MQTREIELKSASGMIEVPNVKPLFDRVVVKPVDPDEVSPGGIYLPDVAQERSQKAIVVAVGPGKVLENGTQIVSGLTVGDCVLYTKYGGTEVKIGIDKFVVLRQDDILAILP